MDSLEHILMELLGFILGSLHILGCLDMTDNLHELAHKKNVPDILKLCGFGNETVIAVIDSLVVISSPVVGHKPMDIMVGKNKATKF